MPLRNLIPTKTYDLIRLGPPGDGGYLAERASVFSAKSLISFGVSNDWRFEEHFLKENPVDLYAYDHTTGPKLFAKVFLNCLAEFLRGKATFRALSNSALSHHRYRKFFSGSRKHLRKKIGYSTSKTVSLKDVVAAHNLQEPFFLKIDIEGAEYRILDEIVDLQDRISGMAIEFHDVDLHIDRLSKFIEQTTLSLVHFHPNEYSGTDPNGVPEAVELSFARNPDPIKETPTIPHPLDVSNLPKYMR